jgi:hypothetical protein
MRKSAVVRAAIDRGIPVKGDATEGVHRDIIAAESKITALQRKFNPRNPDRRIVYAISRVIRDLLRDANVSRVLGNKHVRFMETRNKDLILSLADAPNYTGAKINEIAAALRMHNLALLTKMENRGRGQ